MCDFGWDAGAGEEAAGGEEFGVEQGGAGGSSEQVVREQGELHVEQWTFADAADDGGHPVAGIHVASWLRAIFFFKNNNRISYGRGKRSEFITDRKIGKCLANLGERGDFLEAHGKTFKVTVFDRNAIAVGADAQAGFDEA